MNFFFRLRQKARRQMVQRAAFAQNRNKAGGLCMEKRPFPRLNEGSSRAGAGPDLPGLNRVLPGTAERFFPPPPLTTMIYPFSD